MIYVEYWPELATYFFSQGVKDDETFQILYQTAY